MRMRSLYTTARNMCFRIIVLIARNVLSRHKKTVHLQLFGLSFSASHVWELSGKCLLNFENKKIISFILSFKSHPKRKAYHLPLLTSHPPLPLSVPPLPLINSFSHTIFQTYHHTSFINISSIPATYSTSFNAISNVARSWTGGCDMLISSAKHWS